MHGLRVVGTHGIAQIDSEYKNLHLINKQSLTIPSGTASPRKTGAVQYVRQRADSIIAVEKMTDFNNSDNSVIVITEILWDSSAGGGAGTQTVLIGSSNVNTAISVNVYEFANIDVSGGGSGHGLRVFNAIGQIVFDSKYMPMRVVGYNRTDAAFGSTPIIRLPISGRRFAVAIPEQFQQNSAYTTSRQWSYGGVRQEQSGSDFIFHHSYADDVFYGASNAGSGYAYFSNAKSMLILDVTNF